MGCVAEPTSGPALGEAGSGQAARETAAAPPPVRGSAIGRSIVLNALGQGAPLLVGVVAIPILSTALGIERFGILTLAWAVLGYFSFFDLGLGRALTQAVAALLGRDEVARVLPVVRGSLWWMAGLGAVGGVVLALLVPMLMGGAITVSSAMVPETRTAFFLLATSVPVVILTTGLRGVLEAFGRFGAVNALRVPMGVLTFVAPLAVLPYTRDLRVVVVALLVARVAALAAHAVVVARLLAPYARVAAPGGWRGARALLATGSWITVSNVVGPLMVSLDRFLIAGIASASVVAFYTAPYEAVTKLWLIPTAVTAALFPAFAAAAARGGATSGPLLDRGVRATVASILPIAFVVVLLAREGLDLWLGEAYAAESTRVVQLLAVGVLLNSVAQIPFVLLQGAGRARWTAVLHVAELPVYLALAWWLIGRWGVTGAALAWTLRSAVDAAVVFWLAGRVVPVSARLAAGIAACVACCAVAAIAADQLPVGAKLAVAVIGSTAIVAGATRGLDLGARLRSLAR